MLGGESTREDMTEGYLASSVTTVEYVDENGRLVKAQLSSLPRRDQPERPTAESSISGSRSGN